MRHFTKLLILLLLVFTHSSLAHALSVPPLKGRVNDYARLLSPQQVQSLEANLKTYETGTSNQIVLLTLPTLEGEPLEAFSIQVARAWGLGREKRNNGVLILIAKSERAIRIEVGYGLEGALTDAQSSAIIRNIMIPAFKKGDYGGGVSGGIAAVESALAGEFHPGPDPGGSSNPAGGFAEEATIGLILLILLATFLSALPIYLHALIGGIIGGTVGLLLKSGMAAFILIGACIQVVLALIFKSDGSAGRSWGRRSRGTFWSGRGDTSGFGRGFGGGFSGGGGSFGGGGASGRW